MEQSTVYYIGGPWDLHKVAIAGKPQRTTTIRTLKAGQPTGPQDCVQCEDHEYRILRVGDGTYVAVHEGLNA